MNPYTQFLLQKIQDPRLQHFVEHWDALESLVIRVYKAGSVSEDDAQEFEVLHMWMERAYPVWETELETHWRRATVGGSPAKQDPFAFVLSIPRVSGYVKNWEVMQNLPGAREALNQYLMSKIQGS